MAILDRLHFPQSIQHVDYFFDRDKELDDIHQSLQGRNAQPVIIKGERLVGKTSLLNVSLNSLSPDTTLVVRVPPIKSTNDLLREILAGVGGHLHTAYTVPESAVQSLIVFLHTLEKLLQPQKRRALIALDELDSMLYEADEEAGRQLVRDLQYLIETRPDLLRFLMTMSHIPRTLIHSYPSPLTTGARFIQLGLWSRQESDAFLRWLGGHAVHFEPPVFAEFFRWSGGHPYFIKALLKALIEGRKTPSPRFYLQNREEVEQAAHSVLREPNVKVALQNLWEAHFTPDEQDVLQHLADQDSAVPMATLVAQGLGQAVQSLLERQYLRAEGEKVTVRLGLLALWLRWQQTSVLGMQPGPGTLVVDLQAHQAYLDGNPIHLTSQEVKVFSILARHRGTPVSPDMLMDYLWPDDEEVSQDRLFKALHRLRTKLRENSRNSRFIKTVRGKGYMLGQVKVVGPLAD